MPRSRLCDCSGFALGACVLLSACSHDWDSLLPRDTGGDASVGGAGATGGGAGAGGATGGTGASGGTGGTGGTGGSAGVAGASGSGGTGGGVNLTCPGGMILVSSSFCVDGFETTNADYLTFLSTSPDPSTQSAECAWNTAFDPTSSWPPANDELNRPVAFVDWCDAVAYCQSVGKRLCGALKGGSAPMNAFADAKTDEWYDACSHEGANVYPYGATYSVGACNGSDFGAGATVNVGSAAKCVGGTAGLFDMSGNVYEWENACTGATGANDGCRIRGGAFNNDSSKLRCDVDASQTRSSTAVTVGIRCCADATSP